LRQSGFEARGLDHENRGSPRGFEFGDVGDSHNGPYVDELSKAGCVDASGACRVHSQPSRIFEAIQQSDDV
jgi:hypothetical protein